MAATSTDLFRLGNASSARLDNVRVPKDIATYQHQGKDWVKKRTGGISTFSSAQGGKNEWKLAKGISFDDKLYCHNDHGNHFNWAPNEDMALDAYTGLLSTVNVKFVKVTS